MILKGMVVGIQESDYICLFNLSKKKKNCLFENTFLKILNITWNVLFEDQCFRSDNKLMFQNYKRARHHMIFIQNLKSLNIQVFTPKMIIKLFGKEASQAIEGYAMLKQPSHKS